MCWDRATFLRDKLSTNLMIERAHTPVTLFSASAVIDVCDSSGRNRVLISLWQILTPFIF